MARVVVIGAGISGLAAAYRLRQALPGVDVTVLEASSRAGGNIRTTTDEGYTWEAGPNGFLDSKPSTMQLAVDLGLIDQLVSASESSRKNRYLCLNGQLVKLPGAPQGLLTTKALSWRGKFSLFREPLRQRPANTPDDESVAAFAERRFGKEAARTVMDALVTGIHAGDPEQLELVSAFPRLAKFEKEQGSVFAGFRAAAKARPGPVRLWSFRGGLQVLTDMLVEKLGASLRLNEPVRSLELAGAKWIIRGDGVATWLADAVVLTAPAAVQSNLLQPLDASFAELNDIPHNRIAVVALGYRENDVRNVPVGFGYIAPQNQRRAVLGVQWCSTIFPDRCPGGHVLWRALCGGVHRADVYEMDDDTLIATVHREMQDVLKVTGDSTFTRIHRWPRAIPQYIVGHRARIRRIEERAARFPGLVLGGNAYHGVALNDCTEQAERLAQSVRQFLLQAKH